MRGAGFFLGTHQPGWLERLDVPLMVSHRTLQGRRRLAAALHATPAAVLVSGYPSALYAELYDAAGWWRVERAVDKPCSLTSGGRAARGVEVVWSNRPLREQLQLDRLAAPIVQGAPPAVTLPALSPRHVDPLHLSTEPTEPTQPHPAAGCVGCVDCNRTGHSQSDRAARGGAR